MRDYIGIRGCTDSAPASGMYVNDLEGINFESVEKIASDEQKTYLGVWNEVQTRALRKFGTSITNHFRTKYRIKKLMDREQFGRIVDASESEPAALGYRGIAITLNPDKTDAEISSFITIHLSHLRFYAIITESITFSILDQDTMEVLWSDTITVTGSQWNTVNASFTVPALRFSRRILIMYDASVISAKTSLSDTGGGCGCGCNIAGCCSAEIEGFKAQTLSTISYTNENAYGFGGFASLECSYEGLVCASRDIFSVALWYYMGIEMMRERIHSNRLNKYTTVNKKEAQELLEDFTAMYENEMQTVIDAVDLNEHDCCLECSGVITYVETEL